MINEEETYGVLGEQGQERPLLNCGAGRPARAHEPWKWFWDGTKFILGIIAVNEKQTVNSQDVPHKITETMTSGTTKEGLDVRARAVYLEVLSL